VSSLVVLESVGQPLVKGDATVLVLVDLLEEFSPNCLQTQSSPQDFSSTRNISENVEEIPGTW
jgi:hypothetical protein